MVVKKTVAINPKIDQYIRKSWSKLIEKGYDATYSMALNLMILAGQIAVGHMTKEGHEKLAIIINSFLEDEESVIEIDMETYFTKYNDLVSSKGSGAGQGSAAATVTASSQVTGTGQGSGVAV
jgi:hypothetical protein